MKNNLSYDLSRFDSQEEEILRLDKQHFHFTKVEARKLTEYGVNRNSRILEVGSGTGSVTETLANLSPKGKVTAIEKEVQFKKQWQKKLKKSKNADLIIGDTFDVLPQLQQTFDFAYLRFVLQHIKETQVLLQLIFDKLENKGKLIITDIDDQLTFCYPYSEQLDNLLNKVQMAQSQAGGDRFISRKLPSLLVQTGYKNIKSEVICFTNSQLSFQDIWHLNMGFKSSLLPSLSNDFINLQKQLQAANDKEELFYNVGVVVTTAQK